MKKRNERGKRTMKKLKICLIALGLMAVAFGVWGFVLIGKSGFDANTVELAVELGDMLGVTQTLPLSLTQKLGLLAIRSRVPLLAGGILAALIGWALPRGRA